MYFIQYGSFRFVKQRNMDSTLDRLYTIKGELEEVFLMVKINFKLTHTILVLLTHPVSGHCGKV